LCGLLAGLFFVVCMGCHCWGCVDVLPMVVVVVGVVLVLLVLGVVVDFGAGFGFVVASVVLGCLGLLHFQFC